MRKWMMATAFAIGSVCSNANAEEPFKWDGNTLLRLCQAENASPKNMVCVGYVVGASQTVEHVRTLSDKPSCTGMAESGQIIDTVIQYLVTHPNQRHLPAVFLTVEAILQGYCPEKAN